MRRTFLLWMMWSAAGFGIYAREPAKVRKGSLSGCLDQDGKGYILKRLGDMQVIARVEPAGFPRQNFAKYVGTQVTVSGEIREEGELPVVEVRRVRKDADSCAQPERQAAR